MAPITRVDLYAQGAVITRALSLPPELPPDRPHTLTLPGITGLAEPNSFRVHTQGRPLLGLAAKWTLPLSPPDPTPLQKQLRHTRLTIERLATEQNRLKMWRNILLTTRPMPRIRPATDLVARTGNALQISELIAQNSEQFDTRIAEIAYELQKLTRAQREIEQTLALSTQPRQNQPTFTLTLTLGPRTGPQNQLEISYFVAAAAWAPLWRARISANTLKLELSAMIAQNTRENWDNVPITLCTADHLTNIHLPNLPALKIGRAQAPKPAPRPPPLGLDRLFECYVRAFAHQPPLPPTELDLIREPARDQDELSDEESSYQPARQETEDGRVGTRMAPPPAAMRAKSAGAIFGAAGAMLEAAGGIAGSLSENARGAISKKSKSGPLIILEPSDAWLEYDRLQLGDVHSPFRGRLRVPETDPGHQERIEAKNQVTSALMSHKAPRPTHFDYRYQTTTPVSIPPDAAPHLIPVLTDSAPCHYSFQSYPLQNLEVYKQVHFTNPTSGPLAPGPVEIWVEGSLLAHSTLTATDRRGTITLGMGVEDNLRITRNVRAEENRAGVFGGSTSIIHHITIEVFSSLGQPAALEVLDRLPVTDDEDLKITRMECTPEPSAYPQPEAPIRGGLSWQVTVPPQARATIQLNYRLVFSNKHEIQGGNRRA